MNPTTALIIAAVLAVVVLVLVVWSAVEAVLWLEDHGRRLSVLEDTLEAIEYRLDCLEITLERTLELEDSIHRLEAIKHRLEAATITSHDHAPWSPLYDQDAPHGIQRTTPEGLPNVWADLTTAEGEV